MMEFAFYIHSDEEGKYFKIIGRNSGVFIIDNEDDEGMVIGEGQFYNMIKNYWKDHF